MDSPTATVLDLYDDRNRRYNDARLSPELPNYYNDALKVETLFNSFLLNNIGTW